MDIQNYTLITGASSGIGKVCAEELAKIGKNLILIARRIEKLEEIKKQLESEHGIEVEIFEVDVRDDGQVDGFFNQIADKSIDVVINNAGLARGKDQFENAKWEDLKEMIETNIKGFTRVAHLSIPFLKKTKGHVINISSIAGLQAYEGGSVYCGSKAYVQMISRALRLELKDTNVRVTDIAPGVTETEFWTVRYHGDKEKGDKAYEGFAPLQAKDIVDCIIFALDRPKHVNIDTMLVMPTEDRR